MNPQTHSSDATNETNRDVSTDANNDAVTNVTNTSAATTGAYPTRFARIAQRRAHVVAFLTMTAMMVSASPAFAQSLESKVQNLGALVINVLSVVAVLVGTAASLVAGMKYMGGDPHAREQVKGIAIGAFFAFASAGIVQAMRSALT